MTCEGCTATLRGTLLEVSGVADVEVSYEDGRARVLLEDGEATAQGEIVRAVEAAGYSARPVVVPQSARREEPK